jgi:hypothetical protein
LVWLVFVLYFLVAADCLTPILAQADTAGFEIATKRKEDGVLVAVTDGRIVFDIHSPRGIGAAEITRTKEHWPAAVAIRLHLRGLESLVITSGTTKLTASVASHGDHAQRLSVDHQGTEREVQPGNPLWTAVKVIGSAGKLPLDDGYFELALPAALLRDQPKTITLNWIDFYRG